MKRFEHSIPTDYFEAIYAAAPDPWGFASSRYEHKKYDATLNSLPRLRYAHALEVGCSIGVFTRRLSTRCDDLLALDPVETALAQARFRCRDIEHVRFARRRAPDDWPDGIFDLIVLSEMVYYLDHEDIDVLAARLRRSTAAGGDIVLVHWLGSTHYPLSGDAATASLVAASADFAAVKFQHRSADYRIDVLTRDAGAAD